MLKKRLWHRCFPVNFAKFLRTSFLQNTSGRLLLAVQWKINFNPVPCKRVQEIIFRQEQAQSYIHHRFIFKIKQSKIKNHFDFFLEPKLILGELIQSILNKTLKIFGLVSFLRGYL